MKNYKDSDYALNKFSEGIVYRFADRIAEITLEETEQLAAPPRGGTDCDDPCRSSWYFYLERFTALDSPADGRENASPSFEIE